MANKEQEELVYEKGLLHTNLLSAFANNHQILASPRAWSIAILSSSLPSLNDNRTETAPFHEDQCGSETGKGPAMHWIYGTFRFVPVHNIWILMSCTQNPPLHDVQRIGNGASKLTNPRSLPTETKKQAGKGVKANPGSSTPKRPDPGARNKYKPTLAGIDLAGTGQGRGNLRVGNEKAGYQILALAHGRAILGLTGRTTGNTKILKLALLIRSNNHQTAATEAEDEDEECQPQVPTISILLRIGHSISGPIRLNHSDCQSFRQPEILQGGHERVKKFRRAIPMHGPDGKAGGMNGGDPDKIPLEIISRGMNIKPIYGVLRRFDFLRVVQRKAKGDTCVIS
ncbi:uncharacterized protein CIMG_12865 [Coccidioides immitis RS]|uniref:Uncharacterized protein n=1 Tax=Coccidioides immitis (strain RS) TaxID=246410 RepID=J3KH93_COCIM|nr:uncharacterized protein CIMG_12865 [Coccidioides immitis RS]EAS35206.3 hypothetical protein CIMG_12865 [Coccidioides immitis RS]